MPTEIPLTIAEMTSSNPPRRRQNASNSYDQAFAVARVEARVTVRAGLNNGDLLQSGPVTLRQSS